MPTLRFQKLMIWRNFSTEQVIDNLDMFQARFGKIEKFGWSDLERISADVGSQFTSTDFK